MSRPQRNRLVISATFVAIAFTTGVVADTKTENSEPIQRDSVPFFEIRDEGGFHGPMDVAMDGTVLIFIVEGDDNGDKIYVKRSEDGGSTSSRNRRA